MPKVLNIRDYSFKVPLGGVYVGRAVPRYGLSASKWGNPYVIRRHIRSQHEEAVSYFEDYAETKLGLDPNWLNELRGKDLVCWCAPLPCHADILLKLANK